MSIEFRVEYSADCPSCGKEALFTTIGRPDTSELSQVHHGYLMADQCHPKVIDRIEVACDNCG